MKYILVLLLVIIFQNLSAQQNLPVIRANSKNVKIKDGLNYKSNFGSFFLKRNQYLLFRFTSKATQVKFFTDIDSISFDMNYGETKDFIVLLNEKDSCYTQISATYPNLKTPTKAKQGNDTIPFTMKG